MNEFTNTCLTGAFVLGLDQAAFTGQWADFLAACAAVAVVYVLVDAPAYLKNRNSGEQS